MNITVNVSELNSLASLIGNLSNLRYRILEIAAEELEEFATMLVNNTETPREIAESLRVAINEEFDIVGLFIEFSKTYEYGMFGNRAEYALYTCPRRKYYGGMIASENILTSTYLTDKWKEYKDTFIFKVRAKINEALKGGW